MYTVLIDEDVPIAEFTPTFVSLQERIDAAIASLEDVGAEVSPTPEDADAARQVFLGNKKPTAEELGNPGIVAQIAALLSEYDKTVVQSAAQLRVYITNRLLLESDSPDPRQRIKALEMLGRISDVGLFTEKTEITMRHRPTAELEQMLRERLHMVLDVPHHSPSMPDITDITGREV